ncbi:MAG: cyclase family protein [Acidobacteria bacterium]|nr:cyclase family protein [Acidobacteriota bacterium]
MRPNIVVCVAVSVLIGNVAHAQSWQPPADSQRCPSRWGAGDQRGSANNMSPETVLRAARLIKTGEVIELGQVLSSGMPLSAGRRFEVDAKRTVMNPESNRRGTNDAVIIHTGWGRLWEKDNARYQRSRPGLGAGAAEWLARQNPMLVGADNGGVEVAPNPDPKLSLPVHQIMLVVNGIHLLENMKLDELAAKRVYEFAFIVEPLKIQGGTGSTVAPIAIR